MANRYVGPPRSVFEERVAALAAEHGVSKTALGTKADLSTETVRKWVEKAAAGKLERTADLHKFAQFYNCTVDWLLGETVQVEVKAADLVDTKKMAEAAVDMLVEIDGIKRADAAELMLGIFLSGPSVLGYYKAARLKHAPRTQPGELDDPQPRRSRKR